MIQPVMTGQITHVSPWQVSAEQHGVITRAQLSACGLTRHAIQHRVDRGRLHPVWPNTFAVGRRGLSREGIWMAAVLTCGVGAVLSHESAAMLWSIRPVRDAVIDVSVPFPRDPRRQGIRAHRRRGGFESTVRRGIPVTDPAQTIIDLAPRLGTRQLERTIDEADKLDLVHPAELREAAAGRPGPGARLVRDLLDRGTFVLTRSELERLFLPLAERAGLPPPQTQARVNGFEVDFYFAESGLIVEADGGRFHRTPAQQTRDRVRDQAHLVAGLTPVRFTHAQIRFEPEHVIETLAAIASQRP